MRGGIIMMSSIALPAGLRDQFGTEAESKDQISAWLMKNLRSRGYRRIITPIVERRDLFAEFNMQSEQYRVIDPAGDELVLRPDLTLPVARFLATTNVKLPQKIYYLGERFQAAPELSGGQSEQTQAGIELIGYGSLKAEMEGVILMHRLNRHLLDNQLTIELGHARLVDTILDALELDEELQQQLAQALYHKNFPAYEKLLRQVDAPQTMPFLRKWPWLFGTLAEVNDMLAEVKVPEPALPLLGQLKTVAEFAGELADQQVIVDLSSAVPQKYYTGIVMKGYVEKTTGAYLISGGRYNRLLANFQSQLEPAVGLGINIDALAEATALKPVKKQPVFVYAPFELLGQAAALVEKHGNYSLALADSLQEAQQQAQTAGAKLVALDAEKGMKEC
ncbi:MAG TPA: ATP phosphoribosyltransferase regulatory subunit [Lactobacillus sp.]|nr:ATP phosphoribosyltransferase regulatory subunit [Lactobacillus sp.]